MCMHAYAYAALQWATEGRGFGSSRLETPAEQADMPCMMLQTPHLIANEWLVSLGVSSQCMSGSMSKLQ